VSPLRGEKPQNRPLSKLKTGRFALRAMLPVKKGRPIRRNRNSHVFAETIHVVAAPYGFACVEVHSYSYIFQVSSKSVQGFRSPWGSKFAHSHYFGYCFYNSLHYRASRHKNSSVGDIANVNVFTTTSHIGKCRGQRPCPLNRLPIYANLCSS